MVVEVPERQERSGPDGGVIEDARQRQRRHRSLWSVIALALVTVLGVAVFVSRAGSSPRLSTVPGPGIVTGSLRRLPRSAYQIWVTPTLAPTAPGRRPTVDVSVQYGQGGYWCVGGCAYYTGTGMPLGLIGSIGPLVRPTIGANPNVVLFVASNVAAVRVGRLGVVGAITVPGLPRGDKLVAFALPQGRHLPKPPVTLTALDSRGRALGTPSPHQLVVTPDSVLVAGGSACGATSTLPGLTDQWTLASRRITPVPASVPGLFISCYEAKYAYRGSEFNIAMLLDAHHPGTQLPPLWNTRPVPGQPGLVQIDAPSQYDANHDTGAPLYARRARDAWLIVQPQPGFARNPTLAVRVDVLNSLRITHLHVGP